MGPEKNHLIGSLVLFGGALRKRGVSVKRSKPYLRIM